MAAAGYQRIVEADLSRGMFPALAPEQIPVGGAFDITNGLLSESNVCYRRGGSSALSAVPAGAAPRFLWSGRLQHGGQQTILAVSTGVYRLEPNGLFVGIPGVKPPVTMLQPTVYQGYLYWESSAYNGATGAEAASPKWLASAANRLVRGEGSRVSVGKVPASEGGVIEFPAANYFSLPEGAELLGLYGYRTFVVAFTTAGIWLLGGLAHEIVDAAGNPQWSQDRYSADAVLWGQSGLAAWKGGLVVPCRDGIWLMEIGVSSEKLAGFVEISEPIQSVYRAYVAAGYTPGQAAVFNGHYVLPIMSGVSVVDTLVCRLSGGKSGPAWTRMGGYGGKVACVATTVNDEEGPLIAATPGLGAVLRLAWFEPGVKHEFDADGSSPAFSVTTRSIPTGQLNANLVAKLRISYRLVAPAGTKVKVAFGSTAYSTEWNNFNWNEASWAEVGGTLTDLGEATPVAEADPEALTPKTWHPRKKVRYARMKITLSGPASQFSLRAIEVFTRQDGRII